MQSNLLARQFVILSLLIGSFFAAAAPSATANPAFNSIDNRLPNHNRPYESVGDPITFDSAPHFAIHDLVFSPSNSSQLDQPTRNADGSWEFDSSFNINYKAVVSFSTQPPQTVSGIGTARARGITPASANDPFDFAYFNPQVYDTELVELNLFALSPIPEVMFRESPTLTSGGKTIRHNTCPVCATAFTFWRISSFFDLNAEVTFNGGNTWIPASGPLHLEQAPNGFPLGDYNQDHAVDSRDYITWRETFGASGAGLAADGDWSGKVDAADFAIWRNNFGRGETPPPSAPHTYPNPRAQPCSPSHKAASQSIVRKPRLDQG